MNHRFPAILLILVLGVLTWSAIAPHDYPTWAMEVFPVFIGLAILGAIYPKYQLSRLALVFVALHMIILMVGGHYTYARVPLFDWFKNWFGWARNDYDRLGHFAQGFVPALIAREILIRCDVVARKNWLPFLVLCICLAISACYEFLEWGAAVALGQGADEFLATQGDIWDTQSDMAMAVIGAACALIFFSHWHDREIAALRRNETGTPPLS